MSPNAIDVTPNRVDAFFESCVCDKLAYEDDLDPHPDDLAYEHDLHPRRMPDIGPDESWDDYFVRTQPEFDAIVADLFPDFDADDIGLMFAGNEVFVADPLAAPCKPHPDTRRPGESREDYRERVVEPNTRARAAEDERQAAAERAERLAELDTADAEPQNFWGDDTDFWESRASLRTIRDAALMRMAPPWATLGFVAARILHRVPVGVFLPPLVGDFGSLNFLVAVAATSGGGKGAAAGVARQLVPDVYTYPLGSGEGLVDAFWERGAATVPTADGKNTKTVSQLERRTAVMFVAEEIDTLAQLGSRSGATLMPILRDSFTASTLGFGYKKGRDHSPPLEAHTYRLTFVCAVQPGRARAILGDAESAAGTPQRFAWFPASDVRIKRANYSDAAVPPLSIDWPTDWRYRVEVSIPGVARDEILDFHERKNQPHGGVDRLDTHSYFVREKLAFVLAVLEGRTHISDEDWRLSGLAMDVSRQTREMVQAGMADAERAEADHQGDLYGTRMAAADAGRANAALERAERIAASIERHLLAAPGGRLTDRELHLKIAGRDKALWRNVADAMVYLHGRITHTPDPGGKKTKDIWQVVR